MAEQVPFKEGVDRRAVRHLAEQLAGAWALFDVEGFVREATDGLDGLELKDRVQHVIAAMRRHLPDDYGEALAVVLAAASSWRAVERGDGLGSFAVWPLIDFVGAHGVDAFDASMAALRQMTGLWSAEFAIRPFLLADAPRAFGHLEGWTDDPDHHVRRLVSEGTRPRLPWGQRLPHLIADPTPSLPLLEALRADPSDSVRRSVANHLNDLSKDHPALVVEICGRWLAEELPDADAADQRRRLVRHALRTLVKAGDPAALTLLGFDPEAPVTVEGLELEPAAVALGGALRVTFDLVSASGRVEGVVVDYALHMTKKAGHRTAKVFKLKTFELAAGGRARLAKTHRFKAVTVRRYHPGRYAVEILVNGRPRASAEFDFEA